jgi:hypothetical protein
MAPSLVQSASGTATAGTTVTVTLGAGTTAGNCLVVKVGATQNVTNPVVSGITLGGAAGNFALAKAENSAGSCQCEIWTDQSCAGGQTSVVVTFTAGSGSLLTMAAVAEEWSGIKASGAVDQTNGGASSGAASWSSGSSGTLSSANEVVLGAVYTGNPGTLTTPGAPWTELTQVPVTNTITSVLGTAWQVVSATTAQTYNGTQTNSGTYAAVIVTLTESTNVTGTLSVAMAPMKLSATGTETIPGTLSVAMAPLKMSATGTAAYVYIPQGLTTFGSGGGDRTGALWESARTGEWQPVTGYGPVAPGSVPIISGSPAKLVGRGYTGELAEPAHYTGPEWVPAIPYEPPPPAPPPPAGPGIRERLRKIGAELYRIGGEIRPVSPYS